MTLLDVESFVVSDETLDDTQAALMHAGEEGFECFVLWTGDVSERRLLVRTAHVPAQEAYKTESGLLVRVEGDALHALNCWLFEEKQTLAAQVHAHPTSAFHSDTDDSYPIVTTLGGLSIVVPDFGRHGIITRGTRTYRLGRGGWKRVRGRRMRRLLEVAS
jgi:hypothetical protein